MALVPPGLRSTAASELWVRREGVAQKPLTKDPAGTLSSLVSELSCSQLSDVSGRVRWGWDTLG